MPQGCNTIFWTSGIQQFDEVDLLWSKVIYKQMALLYTETVVVYNQSSKYPI